MYVFILHLLIQRIVRVYRKNHTLQKMEDAPTMMIAIALVIVILILIAALIHAAVIAPIVFPRT